MLLLSIVKLGTLFERSWTGDDDFYGKGNCPVCISETVSRLSGLHASRSQVLPSTAWTLAMYSVPPSRSLVVYVQPLCSQISPTPCSAERSLTGTGNAAKHAPARIAYDATRTRPS